MQKLTGFFCQFFLYRRECGAHLDLVVGGHLVGDAVGAVAPLKIQI